MRPYARALAFAALVLAAGAAALLPALVPAADEADTAAAAAPRVEIFTTTSCPYCKALRAYLDARGIAYVEHNINATLETREAFYASGAQGVPVVMIGERVIQGFNPVAIEAALKAVP